MSCGSSLCKNQPGWNPHKKPATLYVGYRTVALMGSPLGQWPSRSRKLPVKKVGSKQCIISIFYVVLLWTVAFQTLVSDTGAAVDFC